MMRSIFPALTAILAAAFLAAPASGAAPPPLSVSTLGETPQGEGVFRFPQAVTTSPGGSVVYVADQYSGIVQSFTADGTPRSTFGARASRREPGRFGVIGGVATDRANHLYVLDAENERVHVLAADDGHPVATFGDSSVFNLLGGNPTTGAGISASGIAVFQASAASAPVVYVADQGNNRVARFPLDPATLQPTGVTYSTVDLSAPQGLTLDPAGTRLYVADDDHHRVVVLDPVTLAWNGSEVGTYGTGPGQFRNPYDVAVDSANPAQLYVADNLNNRVDVFDAATLAFRMVYGRSGYGPGAGNMEIARAVGALADVPSGGVLAADTANNRIQSFAADGSVSAAWGLAGRGPGYVTRPSGVTFTPSGGVAIADSFDHRVALFDADGTFSGQRGLISLITGYAYEGAATGQFSRPSGVAYDADGNLWVADTGNNRVVELGADGSVLRTTAAGLLVRPRAIAAAAAGVYVTDEAGRLLLLDATMNASVVRTALNNPSAVTVAPDGTVYVADDSSVRNAVTGALVSGPAGSTTWDHPSGLAAGADGLLIVAEQRPATANGARVVRRVSTAGSWDTIATEGAGAAQVIEPRGLALSADGATLLVADSGNNRVLRFDVPGSSPPPRGVLTVTVNEPARGTVTSDLPGIACVTDCRQRYGQGRQVTLTAKPAAGSVISGWSGACADAGSAATCTVSVSADRTAGVLFGPPPLPPAPAVAAAALPAAPPAPPPPTPPTPAVAISRLTMAHHLLHLARRHQPASAVRVTVALTRPATLTVLLQRAVGRRWVSVPGARTLRPGATLRIFTLRPTAAGHALKPGRYRLAISALDSDGNGVGPVRASFEIRR